MKYNAHVSISHKTRSVGPEKQSVKAVGVYDNSGCLLSKSYAPCEYTGPYSIVKLGWPYTNL
jgi:hypothetical protein